MQLTTLLSTSAMVATTYAFRSAVTLNANANANKPYVRVINRCNYDVHLWSVFKGDGCPVDGMVTLKNGEIYTENYADRAADLDDGDNHTGISIKISKSKQCKGNDITQLEYFQQLTGAVEYQYNYIDVSYVDCEGKNCPTRNEGYYLVAGDQKGENKAANNNEWCPTMSCWDSVSCDAISYVLPDDVQTKSCNNYQNMDFYMCGGEAPDGDYSAAPSVKPSFSPSPSPSPSKAKPTSTSESSSSSSSPTPDVIAAAVTSSSSLSSSSSSSPSAPTTTPAPATSEPPKYTKTQIVYVTAYEYVNAKRHAHDHARRHQAFNA